VLIESGVEVQAWPVSRAAWDDPSHLVEPALVKNMRRDAKAIDLVHERLSGQARP
jgi:hypothetical protein